MKGILKNSEGNLELNLEWDNLEKLVRNFLSHAKPGIYVCWELRFMLMYSLKFRLFSKCPILTLSETMRLKLKFHLSQSNIIVSTYSSKIEKAIENLKFN